MIHTILIFILFIGNLFIAIKDKSIFNAFISGMLFEYII